MIRLALTILIVRSFVASFEYRETKPAALFPYYYAVDDFSSGIISNPAALPSLDFGYVDVSYGKPYTLEEINANNMRCGYHLGRGAFQFSWSRFGIDEYREDVLEFNTGYQPVSFLSFGVGALYYRLSIETEELALREQISDFRASVLLHPHERILLGFQQENVTSLFARERDDLLYPQSSGGLLIKIADGISLIWNINRMYYGYINSFSVSTNLLRFLNIRVGYSRETSTYAASVTIPYKVMTVSYGLRHHPYLGATHCFGVVLSDEYRLFERVSYKSIRRRISSRKIKLDINTCSAEELKRIAVVSEMLAERIIKYRNAIGPVSEKSLIQIGFTGKDVVILKKYVTGFIEDPGTKIRNGVTIARRRGISRKYRLLNKRRELFRRLIESGIKASTAFTICESLAGAGKRDVLNKINALPDISKNEKERIIRICSDLL